ncbi:BRCA1-associated protein [Cryptococcus wingfieldii CBS 7118]|uniref:BRCA1-associated protein n=1 Tax=Cryptococcus wingfieldii CBS 7118 TaxID=1295528 RepID=A0A1E3HBB0_9TREE|nr:BRCA1-associated protein [Cryptococcus wingfieldii CBS 7118]ODN73613.1 BRCA1-associated protein [Cryptococcus wingfieldii CBS 7118]
MAAAQQPLYSLIIAIHSPLDSEQYHHTIKDDWRLGDISVDWIDFTREKSIDKREMSRGSAKDDRRVGDAARSAQGGRAVPGSSTKTTGAKKSRSSPHQAHPSQSSETDALSLQPLLAHFPSPSPLSASYAEGISSLGTGVVHLFRHAPPSSLLASIDAHPFGSSSKSNSFSGKGSSKDSACSKENWDGESAEGGDGSLVAILAVPAWMRPADFLEFIGGWGNCLEGVRMIREAATPNRSIVLLKFRDPLQARDFMVIFTGRAFSTLDSRETCHPIRIHHLVLHKLDPPTAASTPIPAFPPSGVPAEGRFELPSCPVCLERLDSNVTGLVTLPCAHTFDCDCLRKWGDSRCPVCRVSHLLLSSSSATPAHPAHPDRERDITRLTKCNLCGSTDNNWICVVCGTVGCGRYEPGKGHARRHWEESGHVLAMELETQRVWDYKGDNYVHRLIQTKNDGKLVELPSASSLITPSVSRPLSLGPDHHQSTTPQSQSQSSPAQDALSSHAGPSSNDIDKISSIESITLEYSYLLSSQLESMRQHYEGQQSTLLSRLTALEQKSDAWDERMQKLEREKEKERKEAERWKGKVDSVRGLVGGLQTALGAEKAMSLGLSERIKVLEKERDEAVKKGADKEDEVKGLEETVRDLMFSLEAGLKMQELGGEGGEGGDLIVQPGKETKPKKRGKK